MSGVAGGGGACGVDDRRGVADAADGGGGEE
jgi:hypothetical protein